MEQNPYATSQTSPISDLDKHEAVVITPTALAAVKGTQFWVKLISISMFITIAIGIISIIVNTQNILTGSTTATFAIIFNFIIALVYCILALRLLQYAKAISALAISHDSIDFESAMRAQTRYWKLAGILTILIIAFYTIAICILGVASH